MRGQQAESTNEFLESQLVDARSRLEEQEKKLEEFSSSTPAACRRKCSRTCRPSRARRLQLQSSGRPRSKPISGRKMIDRAPLQRRAEPTCGVSPTRRRRRRPAARARRHLPPATPRQQLETARQQLAQLEQRLTRRASGHPQQPSAASPSSSRMWRPAPRAPEGGAGAPPASPEEVPAPRAGQQPARGARRPEPHIAFKEARGAASARAGRRLSGPHRVGARPRVRIHLAQPRLRHAAGELQGLLHQERELESGRQSRTFQIGEQFHVLDPASAPDPAESPQRLFDQSRRRPASACCSGLPLAGAPGVRRHDLPQRDRRGRGAVAAGPRRRAACTRRPTCATARRRRLLAPPSAVGSGSPRCAGLGMRSAAVALRAVIRP